MYSMTPSHLDGDICFGTAYTNNTTTGSQDALQYVLYFDVSTRPIDAMVINVCIMLLQGWMDRWYRRRFLPIIYQNCSTSEGRSGPIWDCPVKVNNVLISEPFVRHCAACFLSPWADWCENWFHLRPELIINRDNYLASTLQDSSLILSKSSSFHLLAFLLLITNPAKKWRVLLFLSWPPQDLPWLILLRPSAATMSALMLCSVLPNAATT